MATRTIAVALWRYHDTTGRLRMAHHGQALNLDNVHYADIKRGEQLGVFEPEPKGVDLTDTLDDRPKATALKAEWVDYAVTRGMDREQAEAMSKPELIAATTVTT